MKDPKVISNEFGKFFSTVAHNLLRRVNPLRYIAWKVPSIIHLQSNQRFFFRSVSTNEVEIDLRKLKRNKSSGTDNLPPTILKDIAKHLAFIINLSLASSEILSLWKLSKVIPIFKSGNSSDFSNYRPISVFPCFSKILERTVHRQLMSFLENNNLLSTNSDFVVNAQLNWLQLSL